MGRFKRRLDLKKQKSGELELRKVTSALLIVLLCFSFSATFLMVPMTHATGQGWLTGFSNRKSHLVNNATLAGTSYQINITVHYGSGTDGSTDVYLNNISRTDFGDVQFTASDGITLLNYWIQNYTASATATFWVQLDSSTNLGTTAETFFIYYGNSSVTTTSSGQKTFSLFDNFSQDGGTINTTLWTTYNSAIFKGSLVINAAVTYSGVYSNIGFGKDYAVMAYGNSSVVEGFSLGVGFYNTTTFAREGDMLFADNSLYRVYSAFFNTNNWGPTDTQNHLFVCGRSSNTGYVYGYIDNSSSSGQQQDQISTGMKVNIQTVGNNNESINWVAVRKYTNPEPTQGAWGTQQSSTDPPTFGSITGNTTYAGHAVTYSCTVSDNVAVSGYIASWNNSGHYVNGTWASGGSGSLSGTLNSTVGNTVSVLFYANDSLNNWGTSSTTTFTLTDGTAPTVSNIAVSSSLVGSNTTLSAYLSDNVALSGFIFGSNNSGHMVNQTWAAFTTNPQTDYERFLLNSTLGTVNYEWWANDSSNNWGNTGLLTITLTNSISQLAFGNGYYLSFANNYNYSSAFQELPSNSSYGNFWFIDGFGIWGSSNVTVNSWFAAEILNLTAASSGTLKVYSGSLTYPTYALGGAFNVTTNGYDSSSNVWSLNVASNTTYVAAYTRYWNDFYVARVDSSITAIGLQGQKFIISLAGSGGNLTLHVGSYGQPGSSSLLNSTYNISTGMYSGIYALGANNFLDWTLQGSSGQNNNQNSVPVPTPQTNSLSPENLAAVVLGNVQAGSQVSFVLDLKFSSNTLTVNSVSFPAPIDGWVNATMVFPQFLHMGSGEVGYGLSVPAGTTPGLYEGSMTLTGTDPFGGQVSVSAPITLTVVDGQASTEQGFNPLIFVVLALVAVVVAVALIAQKH